MDRVSKTLGDAPLFSGVSMGIDEDERIGFVGRNGCGKSTFLKLVAGMLEPDSGTVARKRGLTTGMLRQRVSFSATETLADFLHSDDGGVASSPSADTSRLESSYASICSELGLDDLTRPMATLSGGMAKKAALARAFAPRPQLLLLDEPTNHLDIETIEWLERRLTQGNAAFVLITHDRWFLDAVCTTTMEIDRRAVFKYEGGYADYVERRIEREAALEKAESRRLVTLKRELTWLNRGARARATKSERRKDEIRKLQDSGLERERGMEGFSTAHRRLGKKILELHGVGKTYGERTVIETFSREFKAGERIGVVGPNGSGKTTLLELVSGRALPDTGTVVCGDNTRFGYFDQTAAELDGGLTVLDYVRGRAERIPMADGFTLTPEQLLERFLFPRDMLTLKLSRLSGGELRRLQFVRILTESPNFLLLDEPTNDLDIDTIEALEDFLEDYGGCVMAVSHDRAFLDRLADFLLILDGHGGVVERVGGYADYRAQRAEVREKGGAERDAKKTASLSSGDDARTEADVAKRVRLSYSEKREYEGLLDEISALEDERKQIEELFSRSTDPLETARAHRRYDELAPIIEERIARWEDLSTRA